MSLKIDESKKQEIYELSKNGVGFKEISRQIGVSPPTVSDIIHEIEEKKQVYVRNMALNLMARRARGFV